MIKIKENSTFDNFRKLLATIFEPIDARIAFPCFDEPHLKAQFKITIVHPENTIALANFPIVCLFNNVYRNKFFVFLIE